jgi:hypothetical protein
VTVSGNNNRSSYSDKSGDGLTTALKKLPTVLARDHKSGRRLTSRSDYPVLPEVLAEMAGGQDGLLNPPFAEWLMGWPIGWTAYEPVAMDKFRLWLQWHGGG